MELGEVSKLMLFVYTLAAVVVAVGVLLGVLSLYMKRKTFSEESDAPYKLEPSNASDLVAVSDQPKKRGRPVGSQQRASAPTPSAAPIGVTNVKRRLQRKPRKAINLNDIERAPL